MGITYSGIEEVCKEKLCTRSTFLNSYYCEKHKCKYLLPSGYSCHMGKTKGDYCEEHFNEKCGIVTCKRQKYPHYDYCVNHVDF